MPLGRARRRRVQLLRDPAGAGGEPAGLDRQAHRVGHPQRVVGAGDAGVEQDAVAAQLHGDRHVAGGADAGVDDHRVVGSSALRSSRMIRMLFGLSTPWPLPIGLPAGITLARPRLLEPPGHDRVVAGVAEDLEPLLRPGPGRLERGDRVGQERPGVGQDFELHPVGPGVAQARAAARGPAGRCGGRPRR